MSYADEFYSPRVPTRTLEALLNVKLELFFLYFCAIFTLALPNHLFSQDLEYKVKAEFLERFTRFIDWPEDSSVSNRSLPFRICVIGKNPFGEYLKQMAANVKIKGKTVVVTEVTNLRQIENCEILFISNSEKNRLPDILKITRDKPILTVGDTDGFGHDGVLINFYSTGNFIRFEVNLNSVEQTRLKFSSRLLKLAKLV
jgi:hypothetical protein